MLESRDRIGGRVWDDSSLGCCVGRGAQILNGCMNNPISVLCEQVGWRNFIIITLYYSLISNILLIYCKIQEIFHSSIHFLVSLVSGGKYSYHKFHYWDAFPGSEFLMTDSCILRKEKILRENPANQSNV